MTRTQIIQAAKQLVLTHGPSNVMEFGNELVDNDVTIAISDKNDVMNEAIRQANRVYSFLGYDSPWKL